MTGPLEAAPTQPPAIDAGRIRRLIGHGGAMCLLDGVLRWDDETIVCSANSHREAAHPLRRNGRLAAIHLVEYGAQALAVHRGLVAGAGGKPPVASWLGAVRDVRLMVHRLDDLPGPIAVSARRLVTLDGGAQYLFDAQAGGVRLGEGRILVMSVPAG
jgi:predicted hotdog family 3-hydroxylacyl-ACP dehydratase